MVSLNYKAKLYPHGSIHTDRTKAISQHGVTQSHKRCPGGQSHHTSNHNNSLMLRSMEPPMTSHIQPLDATLRTNSSLLISLQVQPGDKQAHFILFKQLPFLPQSAPIRITVHITACTEIQDVPRFSLPTLK